jgi:hypothetical protein
MIKNIADGDRGSREDQPMYYEGLLGEIIEYLEGEQRQLYLDELRTILAREIVDIYFEGMQLVDKGILLNREASLLKTIVDLLISQGYQVPPD